MSASEFETENRALNERVLSIGFTGSRMGMSQPQDQVFRLLLQERVRNYRVKRFVHGGAVGADEQADRIAKEFRIPIVIRPASEDRYLYWREKNDGIARAIHSPEEPLDRNRQIVESVQEMFATPRQMTEMLRSGTWMTIRHSRRQEVPLIIILPDGSLGK